MKDCCSLEIAQQLKERGWPQKQAHHAWIYDEIPQGGYAGISDKTEPNERVWMLTSPFCPDDMDGEQVYAAPTIGELLEAVDGCSMEKEDGKGYEFTQGEIWSGWHANPADALALLWMALKDKGLV